MVFSQERRAEGEAISHGETSLGARSALDASPNREHSQAGVEIGRPMVWNWRFRSLSASYSGHRVGGNTAQIGFIPRQEEQD
jgi:hypothetical protein